MTLSAEAMERIERIEAKLALAEDALDTLNHELYRRSQLIERQQAQLQALAKELHRAAPEGVQFSAREEIPPHY